MSNRAFIIAVIILLNFLSLSFIFLGIMICPCGIVLLLTLCYEMFTIYLSIEEYKNLDSYSNEKPNKKKKEEK